MDGVSLGFIIVIYHCIAGFHGTEEQCSFYWGSIYCQAGCCVNDCCLWPEWTTRLTTTTTSSTTLTDESIILIGTSIDVFLVIICCVLVAVCIYRRPRRPPPGNSESVAVPMTSLEQGNNERVQPSEDVDYPVWFIPSGDAEQQTPYAEPNSHPANTPSSPVFNNTSGQTNYNAPTQNQPITSQETPYLNANITQDAAPPYTGPGLVPSAPYEHDLYGF